MNEQQKLSIKAANRIRDRMIECRPERHSLSLPSDKWKKAVRLIRLIEKAEAHNLSHSAHQLRRDLAHSIFRTIDGLRGITRQLDEQKETNFVLSLKEVYQEILSLYDEFEQVDCDLNGGILSVTTEDVVLEGVQLGPFRIELNWNCWGQAQPYRVIAVDPHPAASNSEVAHPHVQSRALCEGDGRAPIRQALQQGRLFDFFILVHRILQTYYSGSAYVTLEDWAGVHCSDCSSLILDEDAYSCGACESVLCCDCGVFCSSCDEVHCSTCLKLCHDCELFYCSGCLATCPDCENSFCEGCLVKERCENCHESNQETDEVQTDNVQTSATENPQDVTASSAQAIPQNSEATSPVHSNGLGQTTLSS